MKLTGSSTIVLRICRERFPTQTADGKHAAFMWEKLPYALQIANQGWQDVARNEPGVRAGLNVVNGKVTYEGVAEAFNMEMTPVQDVL